MKSSEKDRFRAKYAHFRGIWDSRTQNPYAIPKGLPGTSKSTDSGPQNLENRGFSAKNTVFDEFRRKTAYFRQKELI